MHNEQATILIVDDMPKNIQLVANILRELNAYKILFAQNGKEALERVYAHPVDLILLDIMMPVMDGFEVATILKSNPLYADIPIIFLTAYTDIENIKKGFELGALDYISKPYNAPELIVRVKTHLDLKQKEHLLLMQSRQAAMGEMITMIAHQWRQPLSSISTVIGNLQLQQALGECSKEETASMLQLISDQVKYLSKTIADFGNFFKQDKEKQRMLPSELINKVMILIGKLLEDEGITLRVSLACDSTFETYPNELKHVLINLIKNAVDALIEKNPKEKHIDIACKEKDSSIVFEVSDNAGGIDASIRDRIFEPYFSTKYEKNGMGLGLYMSKTIIEKHLRGTIYGTNSHEGACFSVTLPLVF